MYTADDEVPKEFFEVELVKDTKGLGITISGFLKGFFYFGFDVYGEFFCTVLYYLLKCFAYYAKCRSFTIPTSPVRKEVSITWLLSKLFYHNVLKSLFKKEKALLSRKVLLDKVLIKMKK